MKRNSRISVKLFILLITLINFSGNSCERDHCDSGTGDITIFNNHENPYKLFVDDSLITVLQPWYSIKLYFKVGKYTKYYDFKMIQESGYDSIPNILEERLYVDPCWSSEWGP
jgi:hypothetical protein